MSDTITEAPETPAEFLEGVAATAPSQAAEVVDGTETTTPPADTGTEEKPDKVKRRVANLTRKYVDADRAREAAEARAEAAEALLRANSPDNPKPRQQPAQDVEARAAELVAQRQFDARISAIDASGKKDMGADQWEQAKATMQGLGATRNQVFLQALAETDNPVKLFAQLADDTDELMDLLGRSPTAMAARIGKLDAKLSQPVARPLSAAPAPVPKVKTAGVAPEPDLYNYPKNMSMSEWNKIADQFLPVHLGGKRRPA